MEFFVASPPLSLQASAGSKGRWKHAVAEAAHERIRDTDDLGFLDRRSLALTICQLPAFPTQGDVDSIVEPIMDALIRVAFMDDRGVERVTVQKFDPLLDPSSIDSSEMLTAALEGDPPVVDVCVSDDLSWRGVS